MFLNETVTHTKSRLDNLEKSCFTEFIFGSQPNNVG